MSPSLGPAMRSLVRLSAAIGARWPEDRLEPLVADAAGSAEPLETEEALLQAYLFVGYPGALRALAVWRRISGRSAGPPVAPDWTAWERRGQQVCREVYGGAYERLRANIATLQGDLAHWMVVEGYGKVLGRPGLALHHRELCIVGLLAGQGARDQLYSHLRGALLTGAQTEAVDAAVHAIGDVIGPDLHADALDVWRSVRERPGD